MSLPIVPAGWGDARLLQDGVACATLRSNATNEEIGVMSDDPDKVWPTGLTLREAEEVHSYLIDGTRVFGAIALLAHILVAVSTPWLG